MFKYKRLSVLGVMAFALLLSGCGLLDSEKVDGIDPPQEVTYTDEEVTEQTNTDLEEKEAYRTDKETVADTVPIELYLLDKDGYVVSQTLDLPKTNSVAKQALEYLVKDGPVTDILPNGFQAVLPAETKISVNVKDQVATVDFSKEFKEYRAEDELKILQSVTWTLTQFDTIDKVKLQVNGHPLEEMPVDGTPIGEELSRKDGINLDTSSTVDLVNSKPITVYYVGGEKDHYYYVPVTRRVSNEMDDNIEAAINELIKGPNAASSLLNEFRTDVKLLDEAKVEDGLVTLNFNESIYNSFDQKMISDHVLNTLVLSLTEQPGVESVAVTVNGKEELVNEDGKKLSEPVTRPEKVNTGSF
jgi:germination protein M